LAEAEPDERRRAYLGYNALIFAEKATNPQAWQTALEGWGMIKSETMEKTRVEGRVEGRIEGQQEGLIQGRIDGLFLILAARTKQEVPVDLAGKIQACDDLARLDGWIRIAAAIDTIDEFRRQAGI
jgi:hypothetical protein